MKLVTFLFVFLATIALIVLLSVRINQIPPLGKFLDPANGFWQNVERLEQTPHQLHFEGLSRPVAIVYDVNMAPHIFADNEEDLYFAQGYVTASHRLWQMEIQTLMPAGRLSEVFGERLLHQDRLSRRQGLSYGAMNALKAMKEDTTLYRLMERYSDGVNAYIATLNDATLPIEYKLLDYKPEKWSPYKTALLLKYMAYNLSRSENDLENTNALALYGKDTFDLLFPGNPNEEAPVVPPGSRWNFAPANIPVSDPGYYNQFTNRTLPQPNPANGSNNWAVNARKTAAGYPILANDIHLDLNLPSIWFVVQLSTPGINTFGGSLPGALGVITGFNDSIAWGVTNAKQDLVDWYRISFRDEEKSEYRYGSQWLKTQKVVEKFLVRNNNPFSKKQTVFYDTVIYTHYGPVTLDDNFEPDHDLKDFAMRWTAHDRSLEQRTFYQLNQAGNYNEFQDALAYYDCPAQNFIFAGKNDEIAIHVNGKMPLKWNEQGKFLMDGANTAHEWQAYIPRDHLPRAYNPERGFLFSANQFPVQSITSMDRRTDRSTSPAAYPYYIYDFSYEDFRNRRIQDRLNVMNRIRPDDMMQLQNDNFNYQAYLSLPFLLSQLDTLTLLKPEKDAYDLVKNWDYFNLADRKAPSFYHTWWHFFTTSLWEEFDRDDLALSKPDDYNTIRMITQVPGLPFYDNQNTPADESAADIVRWSFTQTVDSLMRWTQANEHDYNWGNYKSTRIMHLLQLTSFSHTGLPVSGGKGIINANSGRHGVSFRIVTELQPQTRTWYIYPGGQSGNPGSPYYDNFVELWRTGKYVEGWFMNSPEDFEEKMIFTQYLLP